MAHTPGPWWVDSERDDFADDGRTLIVLGPKGEVIAQNLGWGERDNANLIAAAPDLLAVCKLLYQCMGEVIEDQNEVAFSDLRLAIMKAEGET